jgi:hypothetical protein
MVGVPACMIHSQSNRSNGTKQFGHESGLSAVRRTMRALYRGLHQIQPRHIVTGDGAVPVSKAFSGRDPSHEARVALRCRSH